MTTNDLQSLIDIEARSIAAFNDSEYTWEECLEEPVPHRKGHYCNDQVLALARHLVANKHPVQGEEGRIKTPYDAEVAILEAKAEAGESSLTQLDHYKLAWGHGGQEGYRKALAFQDARHKALVAVVKQLREAIRQQSSHLIWQSDLDEKAQAALALAEEAPHAQ